jgi:hypothetical protein
MKQGQLATGKLAAGQKNPVLSSQSLSVQSPVDQ